MPWTDAVSQRNKLKPYLPTETQDRCVHLLGLVRKLSIFGKQVNLTLGRLINVKHLFFKDKRPRTVSKI